MSIPDGLAQVVASIADLLGGRLRMAALYGSAARDDFDPERSDVNLLLVLDRVDFEALAPLVGALQAARVTDRVAPLVIGTDELRGMADAFPLKILDIRRSHQLIAGEDLLAPIRIEPKDLRLACEVELRNALFKLRRVWLAEQPAAGPVARALRVFGPQVLGVLRAMAEHVGIAPLPAAAAARFGFPLEALENALRVRHLANPSWPESDSALRDLVRVTERLVEVVDREWA